MYVSVVASCFNEEGNISELVRRIQSALDACPVVSKREIILLDNGSTDGTVQAIKDLLPSVSGLRLIVNARNFGHVRSPFHGMLQAEGDFVIAMASDLQDPPELIPQFIEMAAKGMDVVGGVYRTPPEGGLLGFCRNSFYSILSAFSDVKPIRAFTGFGLYSRRAIEIMRSMGDPYPFVRGMIVETGLPMAFIPFDKPGRHSGLSKNNARVLFEMAIAGVVTMSNAPIRLATFIGAILSTLSLLTAVAFLVAKLLFWESFSMGTAPLLIGMFFFSSVQILFLGLIGEYVAAIHQREQRRPLVVEKERHGFEGERSNLVP